MDVERQSVRIDAGNNTLMPAPPMRAGPAHQGLESCRPLAQRSHRCCQAFSGSSSMASSLEAQGRELIAAGVGIALMAARESEHLGGHGRIPYKVAGG
jgi:hypothetical protein